MGTLPEFRFTDHTGAPLGAGDLRGLPFVADFVFTRCPDVCPRLTAAMAGLQEGMRRDGPPGEPGFRLLSISVDPTHDTPEVLAAYAARHGADPRVWRFVTGPVEHTREVIEAGFRVAMGVLPTAPPRASPDGGGGGDREDATAPSPPTILHGNSFVLVDALGRIRGYYSPDTDGIGEVERDLRKLMAGGGS
ncbi:SCO family protein [Myxococcota bacterium]|nr:SCO family protein [Myxococcota bacterium]